MSTGTTFGHKTGWGQSGALQTGNKGRQVTMQAEFTEPMEDSHSGRVEPKGISGTYSVMFSIDTANTYDLVQASSASPITTQVPKKSNNPIYAEALITWSVEGHSITRRVNVADGVSVSGVGQAVRVVMSDVTGPLNGPSNGVYYSVAVQVAKGVRGTNKQPPLLIPERPVSGSETGAGTTGGGGVYVIGPAGGLNVAIPSDAGIISVFITVVAEAPTVLPPNTAIAAFEYAGVGTKIWDTQEYKDWVPISPGSDQLALRNTNAFTTFWSVAFGIDG